MTCTLVVGGFFGDEGKGKIISYIAIKDRLDLTVRGGVGTNAGHSVVWKGKLYKMRMIPSSFVSENTRLLIGPGVLVDPKILFKEIEEINGEKRIGLDPQCAIIERHHIKKDVGSKHLHETIGSTGTGCGPCNAERVNRIAKIARDLPELSRYLTDVPYETNQAIDARKKVLLEGTQGTFLSLFHGTYPYVTSKDVTASSIAADVGVGPKKIDEVLVVFKAYVTRVGSGPLKSEFSEEEANRRGWAEIATVTGRQRRVAPFDFDLAKRAVMLNAATQIAITKLDVVFPSCKGLKKFEKIPQKAEKFVNEVETELGVPVLFLGTGPAVEEVIDRRSISS